MSDPQRVKVDGDMNVHGKMEWKLGKSVENHGIYKTGIVDVVLTNGIIYRFEILSKIFSLINLGSLIQRASPRHHRPRLTLSTNYVENGSF